MKRFVILLVLVMIIATAAFAQTDVPKNWLSGEISIFGAGMRYEYMLNSHVSIGVYGYWNWFLFWFDYGAGAALRVYPLGKVFIAELGLGYSFHTGFVDYDITVDGARQKDTDWMATKGFSLIPGFGWKFDPGKPGGFFVQPGVKLPIVFGTQTPAFSAWWTKKYDGEFGVAVGFMVYCGFGYAF